VALWVNEKASLAGTVLRQIPITSTLAPERLDPSQIRSVKAKEPKHEGKSGEAKTS
jgi:hypothetical protein